MNIYIEGGSKGKGGSPRTKEACLRGFEAFFEKAGIKVKPRIKISGGREKAYKDFCIDIENRRPAILLVDSEAPVDNDPKTGLPISPWQHFSTRTGDKHWEKPDRATDNDAQLMVQCMEAWFLADKPALRAYYGHGFKEAAIPDHRNIETVPKETGVYEQLANATKSTEYGVYDDDAKGKHSFKILATIDPKKVAAVSYHARRLFWRLGVKENWTREPKPKKKR